MKGQWGDSYWARERVRRGLDTRDRGRASPISDPLNEESKGGPC